MRVLLRACLLLSIGLSAAFVHGPALPSPSRPLSCSRQTRVSMISSADGKGAKSLGAALGLSIILLGAAIDPSAALAAGVDEGKTGEQIFFKRCTECHINGGNRPNPAKTLSKADLMKNDRFKIEAIEQLVSNGMPSKDEKYGMPAYSVEAMGSYKGLTPTDIRNVAEYVYQASETGNFIKGSPWGDVY